MKVKRGQKRTSRDRRRTRRVARATVVSGPGGTVIVDRERGIFTVTRRGA